MKQDYEKPELIVVYEDLSDVTAQSMSESG